MTGNKGIRKQGNSSSSVLLKRYTQLQINATKVAAKYLHNCKSVLDVGCGWGLISHYLQCNYVALDRKISTLGEITGPGKLAVAGEASALPFRDGSFDGIYCSHTIEHLQPAGAFQLLRETARVIAPGGIFVLRTPLMHKFFYNDASHIRPYPPGAILEYLVGDEAQSTLGSIPARFTVRAIRYFHAPLFIPHFSVGSRNPLVEALYLVSRILRRLGIRSWRKVEYLLVLRKNGTSR